MEKWNPFTSISWFFSLNNIGCIFHNAFVNWHNLHISFQGFACFISMFHSQKDTMINYFHLSIHFWSYRLIYIPLCALRNEIKMQWNCVCRESYRKSIMLIKPTGLAEIRQLRVLFCYYFSWQNLLLQN